ncbi:uncharacterized protein [Nicotiana sylvestris]|uniref:uncharacterized protein n=1 Tax=Nicotiana sylvestris TaxID=4096 RepID=UPI00388C9532
MAQRLLEQEEEEDDDCLLVACERGSPDASKAAEPVVAEAAVMLRKKTFSKSRAELKKISKERDILKILHVKKEGEINDLRIELTKASQERTELVEKFQQKGELVEQLREELKLKEAETLRVKEESLARGSEIEELKAKSAAELAKAKSDAEAIASSYRADAEATNTPTREISVAGEIKLSCELDHAMQKSRRETLEKVHARNFDFSADIEKAKASEEKAVTLLSNDEV